MTIRTGQRIRITNLKDVIATDDEALERAKAGPDGRIQVPKKIVITAGSVLEGIVTDVDVDGFFDLNLDNGDAIGFYEGDPSITIEILSEPVLPDDED